MDNNEQKPNNEQHPDLHKASVSGSAFTEEEEIELQRLVRKIKYNQPTIYDMKKADALTRKKWKSQGIG